MHGRAARRIIQVGSLTGKRQLDFSVMACLPAIRCRLKITLGHLGIDFISYDNDLDTSTPTGKLVFQIIGAVAKFEKDIIRERVVASLANARGKGKRLGRPPVSDALLEKAKALRAEGLSFRMIGRKLGVDEGTIRKRIKRREWGHQKIC